MEKSGKGLGKPGARVFPSRSEATPSHTGFGDLSPSRVRDGSPGFLPLTPCLQLILSFFNPGTLIICVIPADLDP